MKRQEVAYRLENKGKSEKLPTSANRIMVNMNELDDLLSFYQGRCLPDTAFIISKWASTNNLRQCVKTALITAKAGNKASIKTLRQIREQLLNQAKPLAQ